MENDCFDLGTVLEPPMLFCTATEDGENKVSRMVIENLEAHFGCLNIENHAVLCRAYETREACAEKIRGIPPERIVVLVDKPMGGHRCFTPIFRGTSGYLFPQWSVGAWWGVTINWNLKGQRIQSAVRQIDADFRKNFLANLAKKSADGLHWLPFGVPAGKTAVPSRKRDDKTRSRSAMATW